MPSGPDGDPPLAFFLDATSFVGAASVPLGLICLGSSLARLNLPRKGEWKMLPLGAIACMAIGKIVIMPVLGVLICQGLTNVGLISRDDKVLRFVCMFVLFSLQ
jgi:predicted permease